MKQGSLELQQRLNSLWKGNINRVENLFIHPNFVKSLDRQK